MTVAVIDCGTTNSRVYITDEAATVLGKASRQIGVRDAAIQGTRDALRLGLRETFDEALRNASIREVDLRCILSSGMITSEIGLIEIPHLWAPCGIDELAHSMLRVQDAAVFPAAVPLYFVRGIKNAFDPDTAGISDAWTLDFMRGEEVQLVGLLSTGRVQPPATVVILSSHTKYVPIDESARIVGSVTTLSGQLYAAIVKETSIGKSIRPDDGGGEEDYFDPQVVDVASGDLARVGLLRCLLFPRFLDTLLKTKWYERRLFTESLIAAEDMRPLAQVAQMSPRSLARFVLVGSSRRCRIYDHLIKRRLGATVSIATVSRDAEIDQLCIRGILHLAKRAGIFGGSEGSHL